MRVRRIATQVAVGLSVAFPLGAQATRPATLSGTVVVGEGAGTPVSGVDVFLEALKLMVKTDATGRFTVPGLERGKSYELILTRIGLQQQLLQLDVGDSDTVAVRITIEQEPQEIAAVDVVTERPDARMSDYYANRKANRGKAIGRVDIEKTFRGQRLVDVMRTFTSQVRLVSDGARSLKLASRRGSISSPRQQDLAMYSNRTPEPCFLKIFVDGVDQGQRVNLLDFDVPAEQVEAVELFVGPADLPTRFNTIGNACGVVNILRRISP